jgi:hypothetical protein
MAGVMVVVDLVDHHRTLSELDLSHNCIVEGGQMTAVLALAAALESHHCALRSLDISHNNLIWVRYVDCSPDEPEVEVNSFGIKALARALATNKTLQKLSLENVVLCGIGKVQFYSTLPQYP